MMVAKAIPDGIIRVKLEWEHFQIENHSIAAMMVHDSEAQNCRCHHWDHLAKAFLNSLQSLAILLVSDA